MAETNPLIRLLARIAADVERRERVAAERRGKISVVDEGSKRQGGQAA